jgi:hypothetical protein
LQNSPLRGIVRAKFVSSPKKFLPLSLREGWGECVFVELCKPAATNLQFVRGRYYFDLHSNWATAEFTSVRNFSVAPSRSAAYQKRGPIFDKICDFDWAAHFTN